MRWIVGIVAAGLLSLEATGHSFAQQSDLDGIRKAGVLRIGTEGTYAPFTFHDSSGDLVGFDVEIGREVAKRAGVEPEFLEGRWDGLIAGLDANRYDVVINQVGITPERQQKYAFSDPYISSKAALIVAVENTEIDSFDDLQGKRSAQSLTSNYARIAEASGAELVATEGFDQAIQLVLQRRADATINDTLSFYDFKKKKPDAPVRIAATQAEAAQSGIMMTKNRPELLAAVNKALADIRADGTYKRISEKYFGTDVSQQ